jgi:hypothetical protein
MTREDIIRMALESRSGVKTDCNGMRLIADGLDIERFASLVAAASEAKEREQLINLDWIALMREGGLVTWRDAEELGNRVEQAIRARGQA